MKIDRIDHIVFTVKDAEKSIKFYTEILGMEVVLSAHNRKVLSFGNQVIKLHELGHEFEPKAKFPTSGSADICLITKDHIESVKSELEEKGVHIIEGIVPKIGAIGSLQSLYFRDPDENLIEISNYE